MKHRRASLLLAVTLMVTTARLAAVGESSAPAAPAEVTVFAAASVTNAFTAIARLFETQHPGTKVTLNFGGSQQLAAQILESAPADVFASANAEQMKRVVEQNVVASYPIAVLAHGSRADAATEFVHVVLSGPGRSILARFGFSAP